MRCTPYTVHFAERGTCIALFFEQRKRRAVLAQQQGGHDFLISACNCCTMNCLQVQQCEDRLDKWEVTYFYYGREAECAGFGMSVVRAQA